MAKLFNAVELEKFLQRLDSESGEGTSITLICWNGEYQIDNKTFHAFLLGTEAVDTEGYPINPRTGKPLAPGEQRPWPLFFAGNLFGHQINNEQYAKLPEKERRAYLYHDSYVEVRKRTMEEGVPKIKTTLLTKDNSDLVAELIAADIRSNPRSARFYRRHLRLFTPTANDAIMKSIEEICPQAFTVTKRAK